MEDISLEIFSPNQGIVGLTTPDSYCFNYIVQIMAPYISTKIDDIDLSHVTGGRLKGMVEELKNI